MPIPTITLGEFQTVTREKSCLIIDVREPEEFAAFHIPGSLSIPLGRLEQAGLHVPDSSTMVITVCARGYRSGEAARLLQSRGLFQCASLEGGLQALQKAAPADTNSCAKDPAGFDRPRSILYGAIHAAFAGLVLAGYPSWAWGNLMLGLGMIANGLMGWCGLSLWFRGK